MKRINTLVYIFTLVSCILFMSSSCIQEGKGNQTGYSYINDPEKLLNPQEVESLEIFTFTTPKQGYSGDRVNDSLKAMGLPNYLLDRKLFKFNEHGDIVLQEESGSIHRSHQYSYKYDSKGRKVYRKTSSKIKSTSLDIEDQSEVYYTYSGDTIYFGELKDGPSQGYTLIDKHGNTILTSPISVDSYWDSTYYENDLPKTVVTFKGNKKHKVKTYFYDERRNVKLVVGWDKIGVDSTFYIYKGSKVIEVYKDESLKRLGEPYVYRQLYETSSLDSKGNWIFLLEEDRDDPNVVLTFGKRLFYRRITYR